MEQNNKKGGRKSSVSTYEERMPEAFEMILYDKLSYKEFREQGAKRWNISERAAENIWKDVKDRIKSRFAEEQEEIISEQLSRYFDLLDRARKDGNKRVERETLADINKLYGLENKKIDITSNGEAVSINIVLNND